MDEKKAEVAKLFREIEFKFKSSMRKSFEDKGITMPQGMVIGALFKGGEMKISELSSSMGLSNSTMSGIVDRLEKQEIVERIRSREDKRIVYVRLTPKFMKSNENFHKAAEETFGKMIENSTDEEILRVVDGLRTLKCILYRANTRD